MAEIVFDQANLETPNGGLDVDLMFPDVAMQPQTFQQPVVSHGGQEVSAPGDVYEISVRGELPGGVNTATSFFYRQVEQSPDGETAEAWLSRLFVQGAFSFLPRFLVICSNQYRVVCTTVYNRSIEKPFPTVQSWTGIGGFQDTEIAGTQLTLPLMIQDEQGDLKIRNVKRLCGLADSAHERGMLTQNARNVLSQSEDRLKFLREAGPGALDDADFRLVVKDRDGNYVDAGGVYFPLYIRRTKSRTARVC